MGVCVGMDGVGRQLEGTVSRGLSYLDIYIYTDVMCDAMIAIVDNNTIFEH